MEKKKTTKGTRRTIALYLLVLIVLYVIIYVVPQVTDIFVTTYSAEYGVLQVEDDAECLFVRNEKIYTAQSGGNVERIIGAGRLMRTGSHIVDVGSSKYYSDMKGIVSYYYDGYETVFAPDTMDSLTYSDFQQARGEEAHPVTEAADGTAASGDVLFKIVDNQEWYLLCWLDPEQAEKYIEGNTVTVSFADGDQDGQAAEVKTKIKAVTEQGERYKVILSCNEYYAAFDRYRVKECQLITSDYSGILLQTDSIAKQDGQAGVYVVDKMGNYNFTPVKILAQDGDQTIVEKNYYYDEEGNTVETVKSYDEIKK